MIEPFCIYIYTIGTGTFDTETSYKYKHRIKSFVYLPHQRDVMLNKQHKHAMIDITVDCDVTIEFLFVSTDDLVTHFLMRIWPIRNNCRKVHAAEIFCFCFCFCFSLIQFTFIYIYVCVNILLLLSSFVCSLYILLLSIIPSTFCANLTT